MKVTTIGLDLAKDVFQVCAADASGKVLYNKQLRRNQMAEFFTNLPPCLIQRLAEEHQRQQRSGQPRRRRYALGFPDQTERTSCWASRRWLLP